MKRKEFILSYLVCTIISFILLFFVPGIEVTPMPVHTLIGVIVCVSPTWILMIRRARSAKIALGYVYAFIVLVPINLIADLGYFEKVVNLAQFIVIARLFVAGNNPERSSP